MILPYSGGVFAAVRRHFGDPWTGDRVRLPVPSKGRTVSMSPAEAHEALHGLQADTTLAVAIWQEVICAAKSETAAHGPWRLLLIWLTLPRLSGTVYRITTRLRASQPDVEAEMVLALLETLPTVEPGFPCASDVLVKAACSRAWRFARSAPAVILSGRIEDITANDGHGEAEDSGQQDWQVEITPPAGADGLHAPLRFPIPAVHLEGERLGALAGRLGLSGVVRQAQRTRGGRRTGTLSLRPSGRRR